MRVCLIFDFMRVWLNTSCEYVNFLVPCEYERNCFLCEYVSVSSHASMCFMGHASMEYHLFHASMKCLMLCEYGHCFSMRVCIKFWPCDYAKLIFHASMVIYFSCEYKLSYSMRVCKYVFHASILDMRLHASMF